MAKSEKGHGNAVKIMMLSSGVARWEGGKWGHAPRGVSSHFLQSFKNTF